MSDLHRLNGHTGNGARRAGRKPKIVQFHRTKGRHFAKLTADGRTEYFYGHTEPEVLEKYNRRVAELKNPIERIDDDTAAAELIDAGVPPEVVEDNPNLLAMVKRGRFTISGKWLDQNPGNVFARLRENDRRAAKGLPPIPVSDKEVTADGRLVSAKRLSDCWSAWKEWREADQCTRNYVKDVERAYSRFKKIVGNRLVVELNADDFANWRLWVLRESKKRGSTKWARDQHQHVRAVLGFAESEHTNWGFPDGLSKWLSAAKREHRRQKYVPKKENRTPLPPEILAAALRVCDDWAQADPEQFDPKSQRGRAKRRQAQLRRREGVQWAALLRLAAICALDNVDCSRIPPASLKFDAAIPHMDFPRRKPNRQVGFDVPRLTPLLPAAIAALRRWLEIEPLSAAPTLFRTARRKAYTHSGLSRTFKRLLTAAGVEGKWSFKHLRNIGPSVRKAAGLPKEMSDALLGHVTEGTSKFYEGDVGPEYLRALIAEVGRTYVRERSRAPVTG